MRADLAATAGSEAAMAPDDADAPIVAALASHGRALAEAEKEAAALEKEAGYTARGVAHPARSSRCGSPTSCSSSMRCATTA